MPSPPTSDLRHRPMCIRSSRMLSPSVRAVVLETADGSELRWSGGQYVELLVPADAADRDSERWRTDPSWLKNVEVGKHPYSIASAPDPSAPGRVELAVGTGDDEDSVSILLQQLPEGAHLGMVGPDGEFTRAGLYDEPAVFVATGTGVAPLRAMILAELSRGEQGPELALLLGCRSEADLLWHDEFVALAAQHRRFRYEPSLSQPGPTWTGRTGYVQDHLPEIVREAGPVPVFVAGRPEMVADVLRILELDLEHPPDRILREQYL